MAFLTEAWHNFPENPENIFKMKRQGNIILNDGLLINSGPGVIGAQGKIAGDNFYCLNKKHICNLGER